LTDTALPDGTRGLNDLAIFGRRPAFAEPVHVGRPHLGDRQAFLQRVNAIWERRYLTNGGPCEQELESRLSAFLGVRHCITTCNATVALAILLRALDVDGDVLVPSFTFIATAHAVEWQGLTPVFCDIDPATHNLHPDDAERRVTAKTRAILGVHVWGRPAPIEALGAIASRHRLRLIFDAAHAFGCTFRGRPIGGFGDAEVFSFHATKVVNTFEGGAITTNDDTLASRLRRMRNFGFTGYDRVESPGLNAKMSEVAAAMGLTSLESYDAFVAVNRGNYERYRQSLDGTPGVRVVPYDESERHNFQYVVLEIDAAAAGLTRDELQAVLWAEQVFARRYFHPGCHRMAPYAARFADAAPVLPATDALSARVLCLPSGAGVSPREAGEIAAIVRLALQNAAAIHRRLGTQSPYPA
jgi:dTDP-4-amino-4,6-dideoxygalactose transaminase